MSPVVLKTKYAFHALLWLLEPEVVLDVGSMDGSDAKRFRKLLPGAHIVAFEGNPHNHRAMLEDQEVERKRIRVLNNLVCETEGKNSFFVQRPAAGEGHFNRGTSSRTRRDDQGGIAEEVLVDALRIDSFLAREYPGSSSVALWVDVEGHAYSVLEGTSGAKHRVKLLHIEVETSEIWPDQKIEADVMRLAATMDLLPIARGADATQHDVILVSRAWYESRRFGIRALLRLCGWCGPVVSRLLGWSRTGHRS